MYKGYVCMANLDMCVYLGDLEVEETAQQRGVVEVCLLYTSDAADE